MGIGRLAGGGDVIVAAEGTALDADMLAVSAGSRQDAGHRLDG